MFVSIQAPMTRSLNRSRDFKSIEMGLMPLPTQAGDRLTIPSVHRHFLLLDGKAKATPSMLKLMGHHQEGVHNCIWSQVTAFHFPLAEKTTSSKTLM